MKLCKIISLLTATVLIGVVCSGVTLSRLKISTFGSPQARILNNVITEAETQITLNTQTQTTASLTNGATLTASSSVYVISGTGGANDTTNTITIANATDGQLLTLIVDSASSNLITIADSGNVSLSGAWLGDNNDVISLIGVSTNWVESSASDN
jgi:hypothetical protein